MWTVAGRHGEVTQTARLLQTLKAPSDQDLQTADSACEKYMTLLRNRQPEAAETALVNANAIMDRLGLTEMATFARFDGPHHGPVFNVFTC